MIIIKSDRELAVMRRAGRVVALVWEALEEAIRPGVSTKELDALAETTIRKLGARPAFLGYQGFPASICTSVNDEVVHGIPSEKVVLEEGDILSVDLGAIVDGFYADAAFTVAVGKVPREVKRLLEVTEESLYKGIEMMREGHRLSDISNAIQSHVEGAGFSVVRQYVGHGIGRSMHEDPQIPNFGPPGVGPVLRKGMVFALEPMVNMGHWKVQVGPDDWTVRTEDGSLSAHFEHTVVVTDGEPEVLTRR